MNNYVLQRKYIFIIQYFYAIINLKINILLTFYE